MSGPSLYRELPPYELVVAFNRDEDFDRLGGPTNPVTGLAQVAIEREGWPALAAPVAPDNTARPEAGIEPACILTGGIQRGAGHQNCFA